MGAPQYIMIALQVLGMWIAIRDHGKPRKPMDANIMFVSVMLNVWLLWWGGFFSGQ